MKEQQAAEDGSTPSTTIVRFIEREKKRGGTITPADLVAWDEAHGGALFCYESDAEAQRQRRLDLARTFLSQMTVWLDRVRVIKQREQVLPSALKQDGTGRVEAAGDSEPVLHSLQDIHDDTLTREKIVSEMKTLAGWGALFCYESDAEAQRQRRLDLARTFLSQH